MNGRFRVSGNSSESRVPVCWMARTMATESKTKEVVINNKNFFHMLLTVAF